MLEILRDVWAEYGPAAWVGRIGATVLHSLSFFDPVLSMAASDGRFWIAIASLASSELPDRVPSLSDQAGALVLVSIVGVVVVGKLYQRYGNSDS